MKAKVVWKPEVGQWCKYGFGESGFGKVKQITKVRGGQWLTLQDYRYEIHKDSVTPITPNHSQSRASQEEENGKICNLGT